MSSPTARDLQALQRTLFRMQMDASFARSVFAGEPDAERSTRLGRADLELLRALSPAAVAADRDAKRTAQLLGNLAAEFPRSAGLLTLDAHGRPTRERLERFLSSPEFHAALSDDGPLPLAFADWLERKHAAVGARGAGNPTPGLAGIVTLEAAMARARRLPRAVRSTRPGELVLAPTCRLATLPDGTHAWAAEFGADGRPGAGPPPEVRGDAGPSSETLLIQASATTDHAGRREVTVERLEPAVAGLLERLQDPARPAALAPYAEELGAALEDLEGFLAELVTEGIVLRDGSALRGD